MKATNRAANEAAVMHNKIVQVLFVEPWMAGGLGDARVDVMQDPNGSVMRLSMPHRELSGLRDGTHKTYRITHEIHMTYKIEEVPE